MKTSFVLIIVSAICLAHPVHAAIPFAYHKIANGYHIPVEVLYAVMLQESGKVIPAATTPQQTLNTQYRPWPWVLNVELKPYYFESRKQAAVALKQFLAANQHARIAVGLGQIYLPSHGHVFNDKTALLDPAVNLNYAAQLLLNEFQWTLTQATPNWWIAVGRYHTPSNPQLAKSYREDVYRRCQTFSALCANYGAI